MMKTGEYPKIQATASQNRSENQSNDGLTLLTRRSLFVNYNYQ